MPRSDHSPPVLLLPTSVGRQLAAWTSWGYLDVTHDHREDVITIAKFSDRDAIRLPYRSEWQQRHYSRHHEVHPRAGAWYRCQPEVAEFHGALLARRLGIPTTEFRRHVATGWRQPPVDSLMYVVTVSTNDDGDPVWSAWAVSRDEAHPLPVITVDDEREPLDYLAGQWPTGELALAHVAVVGVGSIGSSTSETLASSAVGRISLVDPDRLRPHNIARHRLTDRDIGRLKVMAMCEDLKARHPHLVVDPYPLDVVYHADVMRPLFQAIDAVVCTADGIASRRVVNHLARRAGVPVIFGAVLEDGAFGEIVRVRNRAGCLLCHRRQLAETGALDPEPGLELGYGGGTPHRPMTAAPGDLALVGAWAAKAAISTLLEARGRWNQRLPGDWAIMGLQPTPEMPPPFDLEQAGDIRWGQLPARFDDCPTCADP